MKHKFIKLFVTFSLLCVIGGCSKEESKKTPSKQPENPDVVEKDTGTYMGIVVDATTSTITLQNEEQETQTFQREGMEVKGADKILLHDVVDITYKIKDKIYYATLCNVIEEAKVADINPVLSSDQKLINKINSMSIEEKVGQMFFVRCPDSNAISDVDTYHLGGYILFDRDFRGRSYQNVVSAISSYQKKAKIPLLIGVDEEGGTVNRVSNYFRNTPFWSPQALYREGGFDLIKADTKEKATLLKKMGINANLAPDADVSLNRNDFINARSFGKSAKETATYVETVVKVMKKEKMGSTLKHFPGYGNNVDTHTGIAIDKRPYSTFTSSDFLPFKAGIKAGADSILVSHNIVNSMDTKYPASLSKKVHDILRNELNFKGVIMTDDLAMDAIGKYTDHNSAAVTAVKAGNDVLICSNYETQIPAVLKAVKNNEISEKQLNDSVLRILKWKVSIGILNM